MKPKDLLEIIGEVMVETVQDSMLKFGLEDSSIIKNVKYTITDNSVSLVIPDYWRFIEFGRKPLSTPPPVSSILRWIDKKGISFKGSKNSLAFAISRSIGKRGIKARPFLANAFTELGKESLEGVALQFSDFLDDEIKKILAKNSDK
jgi:hypothetical protein